MDYNVQEGIKKAMNFDGTVDEWVDLVSSLNLSDSYKLTKSYYFTRGKDLNYELHLRNKKVPIKSGKLTKVMICELVREGNYTKMNASIVVETKIGYSMKSFSVVFDGDNKPEEFLVEFLDNFNVKKLYVDNVGISKYLSDYFSYSNFDYRLGDDNDVIKNNILMKEIYKLSDNKTITILTYKGVLVAKGTRESLLDYEMLDEFKFLTVNEVDGEYYIIVSKK